MTAFNFSAVRRVLLVPFTQSLALLVKVIRVYSVSLVMINSVEVEHCPSNIPFNLHLRGFLR